mgnify:CR=1 FL=1
MDDYGKLFEECVASDRVTKSSKTFKINLFIKKGYEVPDHDAAQISLGYLCVPNELEKEDLEMLNQSYKIFEDEYVNYFEEAKKESHIARYSAIKTYTERRLKEIFENARKFVSKAVLILENSE